MVLFALLCCSLLPLPQGDENSAPSMTVVATTEHYKLMAEAPVESAAEWGRALEQLHRHLCDLFGRAPDPGPQGELEVFLCSDRAGLKRAMRRQDGVVFLLDSWGATVVRSQRCYVRQRPVARETLATLLHEATHQFTYRLMGTVERDPDDPGLDVLREGLAEVFEDFEWDGKTLQAPRVVDLEIEPLASTARDLAQLERFDPSALFVQRTQGMGGNAQVQLAREQAALFVGFLLFGDSATTRSGLLRCLERLEKGSRFREQDFWSQLPKWSAMRGKFAVWAASRAPRWAVLCGQFGVVANGLDGGGRGLSVCRSGTLAQGIECIASLAAGEAGDVGLLVEYQPKSWQTYVMVSPTGAWRVFDLDGSSHRERESGQVAPAADRRWCLAAARTARGTVVSINGKVVATLMGNKPSFLGVATGNAVAEFREVKVLR